MAYIDSLTFDTFANILGLLCLIVFAFLIYAGQKPLDWLDRSESFKARID